MMKKLFEQGLFRGLIFLVGMAAGVSSISAQDQLNQDQYQPDFRAVQVNPAQAVAVNTDWDVVGDTLDLDFVGQINFADLMQQVVTVKNFFDNLADQIALPLIPNMPGLAVVEVDTHLVAEARQDLDNIMGQVDVAIEWQGEDNPEHNPLAAIAGLDVFLWHIDAALAAILGQLP